MAMSVVQFLERGVATSREIQAGTGLSQAAVSRHLRNMGDKVIKLAARRPPQYAITKSAFGGDDKLPLHMVDAHGNNTTIAVIRPLAHGGFFVQSMTGMPPVFLGLSKTGLYDDLPYFLRDLAPQGFIGRQIAEEMASQSDDFPSDPRQWNTDHIGRYLVSNGDDLPGNLKFGEQTYHRVRRKAVVSTHDDYPELADNAIAGVVPGSSAGGEQPKFTTFSEDRSAHVIVKFSPKGNSSATRRWRDILLTAYHATVALHTQSFPAAEVKLIERKGRLFLESPRFDRAGEYGRMSMISLFSIDAEFTGEASGWHRVMYALARKKLVSWEHYYDAAFLWGFGLLINNTDMHLGNLSLSIEGNLFGLLPVYDMCSMGFAPKGGEVFPFSVPSRAPGVLALPEETVEHLIDTGRDFWHRMLSDDRISDEFRTFLEQDNAVEVMLSKVVRK